jgi:hypothetical protein
MCIPPSGALISHRGHKQISWGTKQQTDQPPLDLGTVTQNSALQVDVEVLADITDADEIYEESLANVRDRKPLHEEVRPGTLFDRDQAAKDYYAGVRTNVSLSTLRTEQRAKRSATRVTDLVVLGAIECKHRLHCMISREADGKDS